MLHCRATCDGADGQIRHARQSPAPEPAQGLPALRQVCGHRRDRSARLVRSRGPHRQGQAPEGDGRCHQCHGRRRGALAHGVARGRGPAARGRRRADPAADLPRSQPHRAAERSAGSRGAGDREPAAAARRRSERRRSARRQAGVRHRLDGADRGRQAHSRPAGADVGPEGVGQGQFPDRGRELAGRPARRLEADPAQGQDRCRDAIRPDPVLHGCAGGQALWAMPRRQRAWRASLS